MTPEEKQLLFKDLCARLPYGVVIHTDWKDVKLDHNHCNIGMLYYEHYGEEAKKEFDINENDCSIIISGCYYGDIKPYLRPLSSMTDKERKDWYSYSRAQYDCEFHPDPTLSLFESYLSVDWLVAHHFDYRGLIPRGLAIESPEDMYKTE